MTTTVTRVSNFPVVDISAFAIGTLGEKKTVATRVDEVCRATGFLAVTGHQIPAAVMAAALNTARSFFDLPIEEKLVVRIPHKGYPYGYAPLESEILARSLGDETPPDLKESFSAGPPNRPAPVGDDAQSRFRFAPNLWPAQPSDFRAAWSDYYYAAEKLAAKLMTIFAVALDLPEHFFDDKIDHHTSAMRALNYPPAASRRDDQLRAGAHTDYGSLTILCTGDDPGGLEIFTGGVWQPVPVLTDALIINIGDLMARWTNDRWVSTLHRVVNPPNARLARRLSIAFFHQPNWDAEISCLPTCLRNGEQRKYPAVTSGAHLMEKFLRTQ